MKRNRPVQLNRIPAKRRKTSTSLVKAEVKQYTTGLNLTALNTAPSSTNPALYHVVSFMNIASGDGPSQRSGLKIQPLDLKLRVKCALDPNSTNSNANLVANAHVFRIVVFLDKAPNGSTPNWDQVMSADPTNAGQEYDYPNIWYLGRRFVILMDKFVRVPPSFVVYDGSNYHAYGNNKFFEASFPLGGIETYYSDTTNNNSAIQAGNVGMFVTSDASSTAYNYMKFSFRSQLRYQDF
jgi:hypothetical protein